MAPRLLLASCICRHPFLIQTVHNIHAILTACFTTYLAHAIRLQLHLFLSVTFPARFVVQKFRMGFQKCGSFVDLIVHDSVCQVTPSDETRAWPPLIALLFETPLLSPARDDQLHKIRTCGGF